MNTELEPALHLQSPNVTSAENHDWEQAVANAVLGMESSSPTANRVFDVMSYWSSLLTGDSEPTSDAERQFVDSIPPNSPASVFVLSTRDDESDAPLASASFGSPSTLPFLAYSDSEYCSGTADAENIPRLVERFGRPRDCDYDILLSGMICDNGAWCMSLPPIVDDHGSAACRIFAEVPFEQPCPGSGGWFDPLDSDGDPLFGPSASGEEEEYRVCEVRQLEGEALQSCRLDPDCVDCEPGWCWAEPYSIPATRVGCDAPEVRWDRIRLTNGAGSAAPARLEITCALDLKVDPPGNSPTP